MSKNYYLNWGSVPNASQYEIYRASTIDGEKTYLATVNTLTFLLPLVGNTNYYYFVRAIATGYTTSNYSSGYNFKTHLITNQLTQCVINNTQSYVGDDFSYSAIVSPIQGYTFTGGEYSVYMGGNDITAGSCTVNSDGTITIGIMECYGEITIDFVAVSASVPYLTFSSPSSFTMAKSNYGENNGTVQYSTDKSTWSTFTTTAVTSVIQSNSKYEIYFRGTGNTYVKGYYDDDMGYIYPYFYIGGSQVSCIGNIENLLDYTTVSNGNHPTMADYCYYGTFRGCTALITLPSLPATTLTDYCYNTMFRDTNIKLSTTQTGDYQTAYRIPTAGTGTTATGSFDDMFRDTGGTFTGNPTINTTYYTS